jgi:CO/xanthine dehydrogenase FAD-binding subunit
VGAAGPRACRLPLLEARLTGEPPGPALARLATSEVLAPLAPIDDLRATAAYRLDAVLTLLRRNLAALAPTAARAA